MKARIQSVGMVDLAGAETVELDIEAMADVEVVENGDYIFTTMIHFMANLNRSNEQDVYIFMTDETLREIVKKGFKYLDEKSREDES